MTAFLFFLPFIVIFSLMGAVAYKTLKRSPMADDESDLSDCTSIPLPAPDEPAEVLNPPGPRYF